jgi:translation elongation factor EF-Tu-like GTPase
LIDEAKGISTNSVFKVIEEIARIPASKRENVTELELKSLLQKTIDGFEHPFLNSIAKTALLMIEKKEQSVDKAIDIMEEIEKYPEQWSALSLVYFSCDDINGIADKKFDEIREKWNN